jgi:hypothetical protein
MSDEQKRLYEHQWRTTPQATVWAKSVGNYEFAVAPDGRFRVEDVPPGTYGLHVQAERFDLLKRQWIVTAAAERDVSVPAVGALPQAPPLDLGTLQLVPKR